MYNGIGLDTTRGSGTNGYVVRNMGHLKPRRDHRNGASATVDPNEPFAHLGRERDTVNGRTANPELILHEQKRQVELRCLELQDTLEEEGKLSEADIEARISALRETLLAELAEGPEEGQMVSVTEAHLNTIRPHETHKLAAAKQRENERMEQALGIGEYRRERQSMSPPPALLLALVRVVLAVTIT
ncbi:RNA-splicing factor [Tieghemiomyces parasiticus]|uniref:RNA-splicing factor n=1 Tax=Tieghemiomyces parasiticus TaxID=78921 RepID=A0A9W8AF51_9FUNG|nr:RNA-splicing factor [Tieghemiomyces parasiticus]